MGDSADNVAKGPLTVLTEEERMFQAMAREFASTRFSPTSKRWTVRARSTRRC